MNFNYFHTPISDQVDFIGIERRLQTNVHDYNALPARQQMEINIDLQNIEVGHTPASIRESLLEKVIKMGDKFVAAVKKEYAPGIIGPFSLQSVITKDLELVVYDVSLRVPGNPIVATTSPYTKYQYGQTFGVGRRIAMEIRRAQEEGRLDEIVT
jgi:5-formaminoimidazole-4-carboxamide-1-(beta)-D-ribofuranosyl 5'-monophosphate synthetase